MKTKLILFAFVLSIFSCDPPTDPDTETLSNDNLITSFSIKSGDAELDVTIDGNNIEVFVPYTIDISAVLLDLSLSQGAAINPKPTSITTLSDTITFDVTAENGDVRTYTVLVIREQSPENSVLSFKIIDGANTIDASIDTNTISHTLESTWDLTQIETEIIISDKATISPDPSTISDYSTPVIYTVTAQNGESKTYEVNLDRVLSTANEIVSFTIVNDTTRIATTIDLENKNISQKLPVAIDLTQLQTELIISEKATISPNPATITDYSNPVVFQVTSEKEEVAEYTITLSPMLDDVFINCEIDNASKWFGGDKRAYEVDPEFYFEPRNVGTGQSIVPTKDLNLTSFSIHFRGQFETTYLPYNVYQGNVEIKLQLRNAEGDIIVTKNTTIESPLTTSLWVKFDLDAFNLVLKKEETYYLTWYQVDGEEIGIFNGSTGNQNAHSGACDGIGLSGTSKTLYETHLDDWDTWGEHPWHFNFRLEGKE